jgi:hypothetical protein
MKKNILLTLLIGATALMFSCRKQNLKEDFAEKISVKNSKIPDSLQYLVNYLVSRGDKAANIEFSSSDSSFRIDKDIFMFKKDVKLAMELELGKSSLNQKNLTIDQLASLRKSSVRPDVIGQRQFLNGSGGSPWFVNDQFITSIKVKINCSSAEWLSAAQTAITNFNIASLKTISKIQIRETYIGEAGNVTVYETGTTHENPGVIADAERPHYALIPPGQFVVVPGSNVRIYNNHANLTLDEKILAITHELGHTIGLAHTDGTNTDEIQISGTAASDAFSYMNSTLILDSFSGFTNNDLIALRTMYPKAIGAWQQLPSKASTISGSAGYEVFSTGNVISGSGNYNMQHWNSSTNVWDILPSSYQAVKVAVAIAYVDNYFYWINSANQIFRNDYPSTTPVQLPETATDITINGGNELYIISTTPAVNYPGNYIIKKWNGSSWIDDSSFGAVKIASGSGLAVINNEGYVYFRNYGTSNFYRAGNIKATSIAVNGTPGNVQSQIFITTDSQEDADGNHSIMRWTGSDWYKLQATAKSITTDNFGHPWIVKQNGDIYRNLTL